MSVRRLLAGVATTSLAATALAVAAPAQADPSFVPAAADVIGVGSDTTEFVMNYLADGKDAVAGYNQGRSAGRLVSYNATGSATIGMPDGTTIARPNGSGAGKAKLFGAGNDVNIDYARSSSAINATEKSAGLFAFPFAKDTLALATAKTSNAPATIAPADMVKIYDGTFTNWSQVPGGTTGTIVPMIPQSGSGTRSFFLDQLKAANGGTAPTLAPTVVEVQEHDPAPVQANANAVAPFSVGRNAVVGGPLRIEGGFVAARALYNVVRQADVAKPEITSIFGSGGFVCKPEAKALIEAAGFDQLATPAGGGVCGVATQDPTSNLTTAEVAATTTTVSGTSASAGALALTATVSAGGNTPSGLVRFYLDGSATPSGNPAPLTGGKATVTLSGLAAGMHKVVARFTPTLTAYRASESAPTDVTVASSTPVAAKARTTLVEKFKASYPKAASYKGKVLVKESAAGAATGKVVVKLGRKTVGKGTVKDGKVVLKLKGLKKGKNKLKATYGGSPAFLGSTLKFAITVK